MTFTYFFVSIFGGGITIRDRAILLDFLNEEHVGQITGSLELSPPPSDISCPRGQSLELAEVSYTNVSVSGGGDTESIPGTFSRVFFPRAL